MCDFCLLDMGVREASVGMSSAHGGGKDEYRLELFHSVAVARVHGSERRFPPQTYILWGPGATWYYGVRQGTWKHSWIACRGALIAEVAHALGIPVNMPSPYIETPTLDDLWRLLRRELNSSPADPLLLAHLFQHCLAKLKYSLGAREETRRDASSMAAVAAYVEAHYAEPLYLEEIARKFHLSVSYLCMQFKRYFRITLLHYQTRQRMLEAARLLQVSGYATAEHRASRRL